MNGSEGGGWTGELLEWRVMASTPTLFSRDSQEDRQVEIANGADLSGETYGNNNVVVETCVQTIQSYG